MKVLKRMDAWDIEAYFAEMRKNGFEVEPTYDSRCVCRGYSIGDKLYDLDGRSNLFACQSKNYSRRRPRTISSFYNKYICLVFGADVFGYKRGGSTLNCLNK